MQDDAAAEAAARGGGRRPPMVIPPKFAHDPVAFLSEVASEQPSANRMEALAGPVARCFTSPAAASDDDAAVASAASTYLHAASAQLKDTGIRSGDVDAEMLRTKWQYEIMEASADEPSRSLSSRPF